MAKKVMCTFTGANRIERSGEIIVSKDRLRVLVEKLMKVEEFAFDTEATSLQVQAVGKSKLVGISLTWGEHNNYYIPTGHIDWSTMSDEEPELESLQLNADYVIKTLKPVFERKVLVIGQNIKFDMNMLANEGVDFSKCDIFDTMEGSWIIDENEPKGLKEMTQTKYGVPQVEFNTTVATVTKEEKKLMGLKSNNKATIDLVRIKNGASYAIADSYWTWRHYVDWQLDGIEAEDMSAIYYKVRMPFVKTLFNMERRGVKVDVDKLKDMQVRAEKDIADLNYLIFELTGIEFNVGSGQQLAEILFGYVKVNKAGELSGNRNLIEASYDFPVQGKTDGGMPSTGDDALRALLKIKYKDERKIEGQTLVRAILKYKKLNKLKSAFIDGILDLMFSDGKVHPSMNSVGTDSGRISVSSPNLQQLPRPVEESDIPTEEELLYMTYQIRDVFVPEDTKNESIIAIDLVA